MRVPTSDEVGSVKHIGEERKGATADDKVILEMFKHTEEDGKSDFVIPVDVDELESSVADEVQESRKRKNPFEGLLSYPNEFDPWVPIIYYFYWKFETVIKPNNPIKVSLPFNFLTNDCMRGSLPYLLMC